MAEKMIEHEISAEDLELNPELVEEGVEVGDIIEYPEPLTAGTPEYKKAMKAFLKSRKAAAVQERKQKDDKGMMDILKGLADGLQALNVKIDGVQGEVSAMKNNNRDGFKKDAKPEDVERFAATRQGVDEKIVSIVDEILGTDFGIQLAPLGDRPGHMLTLIVPDRLNDNVLDRRPVRDPESGQYKRDKLDNVVMEDYKLPDHRSRVLSTSDSYDAVRTHCERVRAYIVSYYQKMNRPLPDLKVQ